MSLCKCGKPVVLGVTGDGERIQLDPKTPVYGIIRVGNERLEICATELSMAKHVCAAGAKKK